MLNENKNLLVEQIVEWMRSHLLDSGMKGFILGLSGGVDSSVLTLLAQRAVKGVPEAKVLALILPIYVREVDYLDGKLALKLVKDYSIPYKIIDLTATYETLLKKIDMTNKAVCYTNLKARLRTSVIYYYANMLNYLVLGTVNKGEFYIGYFPKNASAGDIMPIAGLLKKQIREIGRSLGLSEEIVMRKASGCIWAETAEEEWGFTEDELDYMIELLEEVGAEKMRKIASIDKKKVENFLDRYERNKHKRQFYPIFLPGE